MRIRVSTFPHIPSYSLIHTHAQGHVTIGGSICTEFLTRGDSVGSWKPTVTVESLLLFIHSTLIDGNARVDFGSAHHPR